ncbi:MAG: prolyl oligopeptidase family serine peptidase [Phycisphaerae bacterium]|nr:prolyl oligopeptidase family serine peptidase [Phycisphaerae bacterium]
MRLFTLAAVAAIASVSFAADPLPHRFTEALIIGGVGKSGRTPIRFDALEYVLVQGKFSPPRAGDTVTATDGTVRTWERVAAKEDAQRISHELLANGYAYATMESDTDRVALLSATGHALVYVNGEPRVGDPYGYDFTRIPVAIKAGVNEFLFVCGRGGFSAELLELPSERPWFLDEDDTLPDLVVDEPSHCELGLFVANPSVATARGLSIELRHPDGTVTRTALPDLLPCSVYKARAVLEGGAITTAGKVTVDAMLLDGVGADATQIAKSSVELGVVGSNARRRITFVSDIDGSVQYYAAVPPKTESEHAPGLILSLHGASVAAERQAGCYGPKDFAVIVCPTNRRPYGFDWEDWGRLDALEVLAHATQQFKTDPRRQWLTGHSMGGHGTWQLGAHFPDRFAAIAPSAGWISFRTYGSGVDLDESGVEGIFRRAMSPSETLDLGRNYSGLGIYILHGDVDDNVPVGQARAMRRYLAAEDGGAHADFVYYERPGANHWWGDQCLDWPPLVQFLSERTLPDPQAVSRIEFSTAAPWVSPTCRWVTIDQQIEPMRTSSVTIARTARGYEGTTKNVARLGVPVPEAGDGPIEVKLDDTVVQANRPTDTGDRLRQDPSQTLWLSRVNGAWRVDEVRGGKTSLRGGPFKDAFRNRMLFVYGTTGDEASDARLRAKARYDAEVWWYRGNGAVDVVADSDFDAKSSPDRNVVIFGNADTNSAWNSLLAGCPILVKQGSVKIGDREIAGDDLACVFTFPRDGSSTASVAVVGGTSAVGDRLTWRLPYFVSGVGYPDLAVFSADTLLTGASGIRLAGFFGNDWTLERGTFAEGSQPRP